MANSLHVIDPKEWQIFAIKMMEKLPGTTMTDKKNWLRDKTDIGLSTAQSWIQDGDGQSPSLINLSKISEMLGLSGLSEMILLVQTQGDCPPPILSPVSKQSIVALASITYADVALIAQRLGGLTPEECHKAASSLMQLATRL